MLVDILKMKDISLYQLSKETKIAYSTLENIKLNKVKTDNISCGVLCRLAKYFNVSMDTMYKQLAMLDILSKKYNATLCTRYDYYRMQKLENILYPLDILIKEELTPGLKWKEEILKDCNPEFLKYNIVEGKFL